VGNIDTRSFEPQGSAITFWVTFPLGNVALALFFLLALVPKPIREDARPYLIFWLGIAVLSLISILTARTIGKRRRPTRGAGFLGVLQAIAWIELAFACYAVVALTLFHHLL
jgi:hypothetical protein